MPKYEKKISSKEARCGFILIGKDKRDMFPASGARFDIIFHDNSIPVVIEEVGCGCAGDEKPHEHHHLHLPVELSEGDIAVIAKEGEVYKLEFKR